MLHQVVYWRIQARRGSNIISDGGGGKGSLDQVCYVFLFIILSFFFSLSLFPSSLKEKEKKKNFLSSIDRHRRHQTLLRIQKDSMKRYRSFNISD